MITRSGSVITDVIGLSDVERGSTPNQRDRAETLHVDCRIAIAVIPDCNLLTDLARG